MGRRNKELEAADLIEPVAMKVLEYLNEIGKGLTMAETIGLFQLIERTKKELTASKAAKEALNGEPD